MQIRTSALNLRSAKPEERGLLTEVPLVTTGGFMKADIVLVRKTPDGIEDVIIIENKLSATTSFTTRQKEGFGAILNGQTNMTLKYDAKLNGTLYFKKDETITNISKNKIFKFSDSGTNNIDNVSIELITKTN